MELHPKIIELKKHAAPIAFSSASVNQFGELVERESLLDQRIVEGYGAIWGNINLFKERFYKGAFRKSILDNGPLSGANYEIKFRDDHGRACGLFEKLQEDSIGLYFRTRPLDEVSWADDLLTQLRSGTINNFSIGFNYVFNERAMKWNENSDCIDIFEAKLMEISAVAIPADMQTFAIRSGEDLESLYDITEEFIRSLPRKDQLQARKIFALQKSLITNEPQEEQHRNAPEDEQPIVKAIDYNYLINHI